MEFILASGSPRRKQILQELNQSFIIKTSSAPEISTGNPIDIAVTNAINKAQSVYNEQKIPTLGADTVVAFNGKIYGKPKNIQDAIDMLSLLNGKTHHVITGVAIVDKNGVLSNYCQSQVVFYNLTNKQIEDYVKNYNVLDKAGAYAIQDGVVVEKYEGSYSNIVGLPKQLVTKMLKEKGLWQDIN